MNHGVCVPSTGFMSGLAEVCKEHGTLLVFDEVACGWGRTGKLFATEHGGVAPDLLCLAKSITNGHAPLAATLATAAVADGVRDKLDFYATFGWHPFAVEAALATLDLVERDGDAILANVAERSVQFAARLSELPWRRAADIHVKGLALAVHFEDAKGYPEALAQACREAGLLVGNEDDYLLLFPPLVIDRETADEGLEILERVVAAR
jgi:putrescine aminotransferase